MNKKKIIAIFVLLGLVGAAAWYFYKKGSIGRTTGKSDLFKQMLSLMDSWIKDGGVMQTPAWLLELADRRYDNQEPTDAYYLIGGKLTDAGALLATYDAAYFGYRYPYKNGKFDKNTGDEYTLHEGLHKLLQQAKRNAAIS